MKKQILSLLLCLCLTAAMLPSVAFADDTTAPTVTGVTPVGTGAPVSGDIAITFSKAMDTVAGAVYLSADGGATYGAVLTGGIWSAGDTVYTIPYSGLSYSTAYTIKIEGFQDAAGNTMAVDSAHSFTTGIRRDFTVTGGTSGTDYTYQDDVLTFTRPGDYTVSMTSSGATTTDTIIVNASGSSTVNPVNITLQDVSINVSGTSDACAFDIKDGSTVSLTLSGTNTLTSGDYTAGLHVPPGAALIIGGEGTLTATGGNRGAGIGGNDGAVMDGSSNGNGGSVTIIGGTVTATGGNNGAGIGGGNSGDGGSFTITGGTVTATGDAAGIGGGSYGDGGTVNISGGTVTATGGEYGAGIGGGYNGSGGTIHISGGTVTANGGAGGAGIGGGYNGSRTESDGNGGNVYISGGSVKASPGDGAMAIGKGYYGTGDGILKNSDAPGGVNVYLTTVTLSGISARTRVTSVQANLGYDYGTNDMYTDSTGKLYLYLPNGAVLTAAKTTDGSAVPTLQEYVGLVTTTTDSATSLGTLSPGVAAPTVYSVSPSGTDVSITTAALSVTFSETINTTAAGTVTLDKGAMVQNPVWSNGNKTVTYDLSGLAYSTTYSITISGFKDAEGNTMAVDSVHSFTTADPDTTPPIVTGVTPGGTGVPVSGDILITFNEAMDTTVAGAVYLSADSGTTYGSALTGGSWSASDTVYTIPYSGLSNSTAYTVKIEGFQDAAGNTMAVDSAHSFTTCIGSDFTVTGGTLDTDYTYQNGVLTFTGPGDYTVSMTSSGATTTTNKIIVNASGSSADNPVKITLQDVSIDLSGTSDACAFEIWSGSTASLTLSGTNTLTSGYYKAGLYVDPSAALIIGGDGTLTANGGSRGAGIGSVIATQAGSVTINGGTITATGGDYGAGIGGGSSGDGGDVTINGGTVTAIGGYYGAGIGGGYVGNGGTIHISGGTITAKGGEKSAGIGGGNGDGIWDTAGNGGNVYISGGSVKALPGNGFGVMAIGRGYWGVSDGILRNSDAAEGVNVYLTTVTLSGISARTRVTSVQTNLGYVYGTNDLYTDSTGKLYLYLPNGAVVTAAQTTDGAVVPTLQEYVGWVTTTTDPATSLGTLYLGAAPLMVFSVSPSGTGVSISGNIEIRFSKTMDIVAGAVYLSADGGTTYGSALTGGSWSADSIVYTIPYSGLSYSTSYTVKIEGFQDAEGNTLAVDSAHGFTTGIRTDFTVTGGTSGTDYAYQNNVLTFTRPGDYTVFMTSSGETTTTDKIIVNASGSSTTNPVNITLQGVSINVSGTSDACAFDINGSTVSLTLSGTNTLASGSYRAGLHVPPGAALIIGGDGTLTATGGNRGAGIGGNDGAVMDGSDSGSSGTIHISGGTVTATGGNRGAGIGGGYCGNDSGTIHISGGTVTATGGSYGAGIGGGLYGDGGNVYISGGSVKALPGSGSGVAIGKGSDGTGDGILKNSDAAEGVNVYLTTVTLSGINARTRVTSVQTNLGYDYGTNDMYTDSTGKLYLYLPNGAVLTAAQTTDGAAVPTLQEYVGSVTTTTDSAASLGTLLPGVAAPTVYSVSPSGTDVSITTAALSVTFSEAMDTGTAGTVALDNGATVQNPVWSNGNKTVTYELSGLAYSTSYSITISGFKDAAGNMMAADSAHSFTTCVEPDTTPPTVTSVTPAGTGVSISGNMVITFGEAMDTTVAGAVYLSADGGITFGSALTGGSWSAGDTVYSIGYFGLSYSTAYTVKIEGFRDAAGNAMAADSAHSFTTCAEPLVPSVSPGALTVDKGSTASFTVAFGQGTGRATSADITVANSGIASVSQTRITTPGSVTVTGLAAGTTDITVVFNDTASTTATVSVTVQPVAPIWPPGSTLTASGVTRTGAALSWTAAQDVTAVTGYKLYQDRAVIATVAGDVYSRTVTGLSPATRYTFQVQAGNADGGWTTNGPAVTVQTQSSGRSGGGSGSTPSKPAYNVDIKADNGVRTNQPVTVNTDTGNATVNMGAQQSDIISGGGNVTVTMPSIPGISSYSLGVPVAYLTTPGGGSLTFDTDAGSITLPGDMLADISGAEGKKAEITIGQGDKSGLPDDVRAAIGDRPVVQITLTIDGRQTDWSNPNAPVTVNIPYTPTADELKNPDSIVVWYIDGSGNPQCVTNGHYDPATGTVTFDVTHFSDYAVVYNPVSFNDVSSEAWYYRAVSFIAARDITSGTGGGNFSPGAKLTRGDFLVMLMKAYGIAPDTSPADNFSDAGSTYYTGYLAAAKRLGISAGVGNNLYAPGKEITRQEMFTLLYNALRVIGQLPRGDSGKTLSDFSDSSSVADWAKDAMTLLVKTGTVGGSGGKLNPLSTTIRAEMAQVLYNLLGK